MDAKTISMYASADGISENDLFFISKKVPGDGSSSGLDYSSQKMPYSTLKESLLSVAIDGVSSHFNFNGLSDFGNQLSGPLYSLLSGDLTVGGRKTFLETPTV